MPQPSRTVVPGAPHHVALRGNNRRVLFTRREDYEQFLFYASCAKQKVPIDLHAAALMTNHVHLVLRPPETDSLSDFVQHLAQRYAQYRNDKRGSTGKLFERRFFSKPIVDEAQLAVTLAYVELNPIRAGIPARSPKHRWTTYWNHVGAERPALSRALWTPSPWYLDLGSTDEERAARYAEWVKDCLRLGKVPADVETLEFEELRFAANVRMRPRRPDGSGAT